jgi:ketosteroid isomerase-like protein
MNKAIFKQATLVLCFLMVVFGTNAQAQQKGSAAKNITDAMNKAADEWNKGQLDAFMSLYDPSATMMMPTGPVGMGGIKDLYQTKYFKDGMPKQNLKYNDMHVRMLGNDFALLTGGFTLYGNNLPERSGRYSLVLQHTKDGWKILHDHSS